MLGPSNPIVHLKNLVSERIGLILSLPSDTILPSIETSKTGPYDIIANIPRLRLPGDPKNLALTIMKGFVLCDLIISSEVTTTSVGFKIALEVFSKLVLGPIYASRTPAGINRGQHHFGENASGNGKKIIIEFSNPNITKDFDAGHLRSTILGAFLSNVYEACGWGVIRVNYLGDSGAESDLLAVAFERYGSEEELKKDVLAHLHKIDKLITADVKAEEAQGVSKTKDQARAYLNNLEDAETEAPALWSRLRSLAVDAYVKVYHRMTVRFDAYLGALTVSENGLQTTMAMLESTGLFCEKAEGGVRKGPQADPSYEKYASIAIDLNAWNLGRPVLRTHYGTLMPLLRDVASAIELYDAHSFDKMIYVVGEQHDAYYAQVFKILSLISPHIADRVQHINFGRVLGIRPHTGKFEVLSEILDFAQGKMLAQTLPRIYRTLEDPDNTADEIGATAIKIQDLQVKRTASYRFDWDRLSSYDGDTGPFLQWTYSRLCAFQRRVGPDIVLRTAIDQIDVGLLNEKKARDVIFHLAAYPNAVIQAQKSHESAGIVAYCFRLANLIHFAKGTLLIKDQDEELSQARLLLFESARIVWASAMRLLSVTPLEML